MIITTWSAFRGIFATSATLGPDGVELWHVASVRAAGFDTGFAGIAKPIPSFPIIININGGAYDAVPGTDDYNWYVSQRTDDAAAQYLAVSRNEIAPNTQSGQIQLDLTTLAVAALGLGDPTDPLNEDQLIRVVKHVHLYVQRKADDAIQVCRLDEATLSDY